ncbi:MAG: hypothetical protein PUH75_07960, partial [Collinsella sp.]|nr:hypothetical protein [Collinsella sp.]MDY5439105.1 hypothetical protein [Collinsella sp.]
MEAAAPRAETAIAVPIAPGAPGPLAAHIVPTTAEETVPPKPRKNIASEVGLATLMWTVPGGAQETGGPYMRDPRHPRHFTDEFKRQIVDLYNAGKP